MTCKNCEAPLGDDYTYCLQCGAKVVKDRITVKRMWRNVSEEVFGWDNRYLRTIVGLLVKPGVVLKSYLEGTRKKYMAPFALLAIHTAISMLVFNQFSDKYLEMTDAIGSKQYELMEQQIESADEKAEFLEQKSIQIERSRKIQEGLLKYYNVFTFFLIPVYGLCTFLVFGKPYNYGEHLVITAYVQGFTLLISLIFFLISVATDPMLYSFSLVFTILFYLYAYGKLYKHSLLKLVVLFFKFLGVAILLSVVLGIVGVAVGITIKLLGS